MHWIKLGTAVLTAMDQQIAQVMGVPSGFVYSTADGIYYLSEAAPRQPDRSSPTRH